MASVIFTTTIDLNADYPALAARALGWHDVALMCMHEMNVPHGVPQCIRILLHWNTRSRGAAKCSMCTSRARSICGPIGCQPARTVISRKLAQAEDSMVIVMQHGASAKQIAAIVARVESMGYRAHLVQGEERTIIGVIGDDRPIDRTAV